MNEKAKPLQQTDIRINIDDTCLSENTNQINSSPKLTIQPTINFSSPKSELDMNSDKAKSGLILKIDNNNSNKLVKIDDSNLE